MQQGCCKFGGAAADADDERETNPARAVERALPRYGGSASPVKPAILAGIAQRLTRQGDTPMTGGETRDCG